MSFQFSLLQPLNKDADASVFLVKEDLLFCTVKEGGIQLPTVAECIEFEYAPDDIFAIGKVKDGIVYTGDGNKITNVSESTGYSFYSLRMLLTQIHSEMIKQVLCALHAVRWHTTSRYCGQCGNALFFSEKESAKECRSCGFLHFPRISPAIIVAVCRENTILLGRSERFPGKFFSVIAGFVEPGENLEECVVREVKEETGITVDSITYFGSQPWPFPDSLMCGFTASYVEGTVIPDGHELVEAGWYTADALPNIPEGYSISRRLIDWFITQNT